MTNFKVGISTSSIETSVNKGIIDGIGHYTKQLIENLERKNIQYKKYAFPGILQKSRFQESESLHFSFPFLSLAAKLTAGKLFQFNPKIDVFHCTDFKIVPMKCPVVATWWDIIPWVNAKWISGNSFKLFMTRFLLQGGQKFVDRIIVPSEYTANDLIKYFNISEKIISIVPWAVDEKWFNPIEDQNYQNILQKYELSDGYILSVGTLQPRKNFMSLLDAYLLLPEKLRKQHKLVIVGKYGWKSEVLVSRMQQLEKEGVLKWLSNVHSDDDLRCIYKGASVFAFPSLYEGFGIPIAEAFASGVPVVSSNRTSLPEVSKGAAIEINPETISEMAEAIELLLTDTSERAKRIELGLKRASQLSWASCLEKTLEVYQQALRK